MYQTRIVNLARIFPGTDPKCIRCHQAPATFGHMFWTCPRLGTFWSEIFNTSSYICRRRIDPDTVIATFGNAPSNSGISRHQSNLIAFSTQRAHRLILLSWKSQPLHLIHIGSMRSCQHSDLKKSDTRLRAPQESLKKHFFKHTSSV